MRLNWRSAGAMAVACSRHASHSGCCCCCAVHIAAGNVALPVAHRARVGGRIALAIIDLRVIVVLLVCVGDDSDEVGLTSRAARQARRLVECLPMVRPASRARYRRRRAYHDDGARLMRAWALRLRRFPGAVLAIAQRRASPQHGER